MARRANTSARKQPSQERSRHTVDALLAATARVLVRDGYDRASTNRIAEAAGVSIGSLYQYFPSKEALVGALVAREFEEQCRIVEQKLSEVLDAPLEVAVRKLVEAVVLAHRVHPRLHKVLSEEVPRVGALARVVQLEARVAELMRVALEARRADIRPKDLKLVALLLVHAVEGVVHGVINYHPELIEERELIDQLAELCARYLTKDRPTP
jgi:AcrR family transcriptional regulator